MQPRSTEMATMNVDSLLNLPEMHNPQNGESDFDPTSSHDDFIDQILSSTSSFPWEFVGGAGETNLTDDQSAQLLSHFDDQSALLASKLRHNQIGDGSAGSKALMHQQQLMLSGGVGLPAGAESGLLLPVPSSHNGRHDVVNGSSKPTNPANEALHNTLIGSLGQTSNQPPHFHHPEGEAIQAHNFGAMNQSAGSGGGTPPKPKPRVRARRGQATDPHSIAERLRRERIAERMKALQELVPNANKTDKASMLDEIIDYVKFLQLQVKVLSMSRMGNAAAVLPRVADISAEGRSSNSHRNNNDGMNATEQQVAKLLEQDMGSAMQYLQGKGLCLMPISLANAVSTATRNPMVGGPTSPSLSALTVQSTVVGGRGGREAKVKDGTTPVTSKS